MENALISTQGGALEGQAGISFLDAVDAWLNSDEMFRVREQSKVTYRRALKAFQKFLDAQGISSPSRQDVIDFLNAMDADKNLTTATKNLRLTTLRNFFKWLATRGGENIAAGIKNLKETREHRRGFLSCPQMKKLIDCVDSSTLKGKRDKAILGVLLTAGLRTIEISRLTVGDLVESGGVYFLNVIGKGRDDSERVKISRQAKSLIDAWQIAREKKDFVTNESPLFCSLSDNSFGEVLSSFSVSRLCKEYLTAAGLKSEKIVAHSLRHSMATNALLKGATLQEVQQQLRHANLSTTQIYLHEAQKALNRCTDLISEEIF